MKKALSSLILLTLLCANGVSAQESIGLIPADFGDSLAEPSLVDDVAQALSQRADVAPFSYAEGVQVIAGHFGTSPGIDAEALQAVVDQGEDAYFQVEYDASVSALQSDVVQAAYDAITDMATDSEVADLVRRALLGRARVHFIQGQDFNADEAILASLRRFPNWVATTEYYQPRFVERYETVRDGLQAEMHALTIVTDSAECSVAMNGLEIGTGSSVSLPVATGEYAIRASCEGTDSGIRIVTVTGETTAMVSARFDARYDIEHGRLRLEEDSADNVTQIEPFAATFSNLIGLDQVLLISIVQDPFLGPALQLVHGDFRSGSAVRVARAGQTRGGAYPVSDALSALFDGATVAHVLVNDGGGFSVPYAGNGDPTDTTGPSPVPWIVIGVGGAAVVAGVIFSVLESGAFDDFESCRVDPVCSGEDTLDQYREDGESFGLIATVSYSVGAAAVATGVLMLILRSSTEEPVEDVSTATLTPVFGQTTGLRFELLF